MSPTRAVERRYRVGVDLTDVARLRRLLSESPDILGTIFTAREQAYCAGKRRRYEHLAARFAAKEAVFKSFGTGLGPGMCWTDVEVVNDLRGRPTVELAGETAVWATRRGLIDLDLSLSHTPALAIAQVIAVWAAETDGDG